MAFTLAVAGKGGTGKTTLAALLIQTLVERGEGPVLAVDADPNPNLGYALGARWKNPSANCAMSCWTKSANFHPE